MAFRIDLKHFHDMNTPNLMGAPAKQSILSSDQHSEYSETTLVVPMRNHSLSHQRNSPYISGHCCSACKCQLGHKCAQDELIEEEHFKQLLDCWSHFNFEIEACLIFMSSLKAARSTARGFPSHEELHWIGSIFFCHCRNILQQWLIVIINHAWKNVADEICIITVNSN